MHERALKGHNKTNRLINSNCLMFLFTFQYLWQSNFFIHQSADFKLFLKKQMQHSHDHSSTYVALFHLSRGNPQLPLIRPKPPFFLHPAPKKPTKTTPHDVFLEVSPRECYLRCFFSRFPRDFQRSLIMGPLLGMGMGIAWGRRSPHVLGDPWKSPRLLWSNSQIKSANPSAPWKLLISKNFLTLLGTHEPQDIG